MGSRPGVPPPSPPHTHPRPSEAHPGFAFVMVVATKTFFCRGCHNHDIAGTPYGFDDDAETRRLLRSLGEPDRPGPAELLRRLRIGGREVERPGPAVVVVEQRVPPAKIGQRGDPPLPRRLDQLGAAAVCLLRWFGPVPRVCAACRIGAVPPPSTVSRLGAVPRPHIGMPGLL